MTEDEIIQFAEGLPGVDVLTASEATGAPEIAWGDSFFYFDPDRDIPGDRRFPFATTQGWVSILNPGERTDAQVRILLADAHTRAVRRHRPLR